jgi:hypothetical protein
MARIANDASEGRVMITMAIGFGAGVFYWLGIYNLAFWILVYAIVYGGLSVVRGHGHMQPIYRRDSGLATAVLIPVAWHMAALAGYL